LARSSDTIVVGLTRRIVIEPSPALPVAACSFPSIAPLK